MKNNIRKAQKKDAIPVYELVNQLKENPLNQEVFFHKFNKNIIDPDMEYWLLEYHEKIIGFASIHGQHPLHHDETVYEIQEFVIESGYRGKGFGSYLLQFIIDRYKQLELSSNKTRVKAKVFYEKHGFVATHNKFVKSIDS